MKCCKSYKRIHVAQCSMVLFLLWSFACDVVVRLLVVCGRLLVVCGCFLVVRGRLLLVCGGLWSLSVLIQITTFQKRIYRLLIKVIIKV